MLERSVKLSRRRLWRRDWGTDLGGFNNRVFTLTMTTTFLLLHDDGEVGSSFFSRRIHVMRGVDDTNEVTPFVPISSRANLVDNI